MEIDKLTVTFRVQEGLIYAVDELSFTLERGRTLGIAGESGCGKSVSTQAILRLIPKNGTILQGQILFNPDGDNPIDITALKSDSQEIRAIRGRDISIIFQEPMTSFSPVITVGRQIDEVIMLHQKLDKKAAREKSIEMLNMVGMPNASAIHAAYTYNLSGGMRQRAMIAMALAGEPEALIADEPTTALDVTVEAQILTLLDDLRTERGLSMILISHDLGIIAQRAQRAAVMYAGRIVEEAGASELIEAPLHPYTKALIRSIPGMSGPGGSGRRLPTIPGAPPDPFGLPEGCRFRDRCPLCPECDRPDEPPLIQVGPGRRVRCWEYG